MHFSVKTFVLREEQRGSDSARQRHRSQESKADHMTVSDLKHTPHDTLEIYREEEASVVHR